MFCLYLAIFFFGVQGVSAQTGTKPPCNNMQYKLYPNTNIFGGTLLANNIGLGSCKRLCTFSSTCVAVDWNYQTRECTSHDANTAAGFKYQGGNCCMHCVGVCADLVPSTTTTPSTPPPTIPTSPTSPSSSVSTSPSSSVSTSPSSSVSVTIPSSVTTIPTTPTTGGIPDTGCPHSLLKTDGKFHQFGQPVVGVTDLEACKLWCLTTSYCQGINFIKSTSECQYLRQIAGAAQDNTDSIIVVKVACSPPTKCWVHTVAPSATMSSVTNASATQEDCPSGICFVKATTGNPSTYERGCVTDTTGIVVECKVDATLMANICYCDTARCNGLSVDALTDQRMYLPLDQDLFGHAGVERNGELLAGGEPLIYSCNFKAVNCSAVFVGQQCVSVPGMKDVALGQTASFAVWFNRLSGSADAEEGIFGNSASATEIPSWQIMSNTPKGYVSAALQSVDGEMQVAGEFDFPLNAATEDEWHLAVMTYTGLTDPFFPTLKAETKFYVDGQPVTGNQLVNKGDIKFVQQPVTIGCLLGKNFEGLIDEARVFGSELTLDDIKALQAMRDV